MSLARYSHSVVGLCVSVIVFCCAEAFLTIPLSLALTFILYIVHAVKVSELLQQSTSDDFQVERFPRRDTFQSKQNFEGRWVLPMGKCRTWETTTGRECCRQCSPQRSPHTHTNTHKYTQFAWRPIPLRPWCGGFCTMSVFILILFNVDNTFECESTHDLYSFVMFCKQWLTFCLHKKLNLNMLILTPQIIRTLESCGISMK